MHTDPPFLPALPYLLLALTLCGCPGGGDPIETAEDALTSVSDVPEIIEDTEVADVPDVMEGPLQCDEAPEVDGPFVAHGLGVRITNPTGGGGVLYSGGSLSLGGVAFGEITSLKWTLGDESGSIVATGFWQVGGIALKSGDNLIEVVAEGPAGTARDSVLVHVHPSLISGVDLVASPDHVYTGEERGVRVTFSYEVGNLDDESVKLVEVDATGKTLPTTSWNLRDDGNADSCDDVAGDRVFGACITVLQTAPGQRCFRATMETNVGTATSQLVCLDVFERISVADCLGVEQALTNANSAYTSTGDHSAGLVAARGVLTQAGATVVGNAAGEYGVWARFPSGMLAALPLGIPSGYRGTPVDSRTALLLTTSGDDDEVIAAGSFFRPDTCPPFDTRGPHQGAAASVSRFREIRSAGIVAFAGHGGAFFEGLSEQYGWHHPGHQEIMWSGTTLNCGELQTTDTDCKTDTDCPAATHCVAVTGGEIPGTCVDDNQADLATGRLVVGPAGLGITPAFVERVADGKLPKTLVYSGACHSAYSGSLAMAFLGNGAGAYVGYSDLARSQWADAVGTQLFEGLATRAETVSEALCHSSDPKHPETETRLYGANALSAEVSGIFNQDFEQAGLLGWTRTGDARQLTSFCGQEPTQGKFMGLLSTGLGGSILNGTSGTFEQTFCIPASAKTLTFWWRFYSAELEEFCGTGGFQDRWEVTLSTSQTELEVKRCAMDDMCFYDTGDCQPKMCAPPSTCGCGDCYEPYFDVTECSFEGQPVKATAFVQETFSVTPLAGGGPVTLRISMKDAGDGVNDTAILIDDISLQ
ncbi:MAG: hypothetical protein ACI9OJ_003348 [Myxococcota bacterium]|jgi:hypothetical protein